MPVKKLSAPDLDRVKRRMSYNPHTGEVLLRYGNSVVSPPLGKSARVSIGGKQYFVSRLCWYIQTGEWPEEISLRRGDSLKFSNLRNCSHAQSCCTAPGRNRLNSKGVSEYKSSFRVRVMKNGRRVRSASFRTLDEAKAAYAKWSIEIHGSFAHIAQSDLIG